MHESKSRYYLMFVHFHLLKSEIVYKYWVVQTILNEFMNTVQNYRDIYLIVEEDEVHLDEDECHTRSRSERQQNVVTIGIGFQFKILTELQSWINHGTNAECWK